MRRRGDFQLPKQPDRINPTQKTFENGAREYSVQEPHETVSQY
jgi:hypothetical protein